MFPRALSLPSIPRASFFLWGQRQTGKSTLLRSSYPDALWINLLDPETHLRHLREPWLLRDIVGEKPETSLVVIDEVQKVPQILDTVHLLIEDKKIAFVLCGSSARKVRRGHANLLGGRAVRHELFGLTSFEMGTAFDLTRMLTHGVLPRHYLADDPVPFLRSYITDYLREEILEEGLTRNLPSFAAFLDNAALSDGGQISFQTIARESGVSNHTVRSFFEILEDTLVGSFLPAYTARSKRRQTHVPKFYFADVGIVNILAKRSVERGSQAFGQALENVLFHEIRAWNSYKNHHLDLCYWKLTNGAEVDFVLGDMRCAIEVKATERVLDHHLKGLRELGKDFPHALRILVSLDSIARKTTDGIRLLPVEQFLQVLWGDGILIGH